MTRSRPGLWPVLGLAAILFIMGCQDRYALRRPAGPQAKLDLPSRPPEAARRVSEGEPRGGMAQQQYPLAVPPTGTAVQQATFTAPVSSNNPPPMVPPDRPALQGEGFARVESIAALAQKRVSEMTCYYVRMRRREVVNGAPLPEDIALCKFRSEPFSVYLKALDESPTAGREVLFVAGRYNDMLQIRTGKGDVMAGLRMELSPTSPRALASCRRSLLESGFPNIVGRFTKVVEEERANPQGRLTSVGTQVRPECGQPLEVVRQVVPPGKEKHLPRGGERFWHFATNPVSAEYGLPMLIYTLDENQREVEYYAHDRLVLNVSLCDDDFDPTRLWGQ